MTTPPTPTTPSEPIGPVLPAPPSRSTPAHPTGKWARILRSKPFIATAIVVVLIGVGVATNSSGNNHAASPPAITASPYTPTSRTAPTPTPGANVSPPAQPAPSAKKNHRSLSSHTFKLLAKDPDAYIGDTYVIYGEITQFDAATGTEAFRANTGPKKLRISYGYVDYTQNSILGGSVSKLSKLVEGDCFSAKVTVLGSYSYDTQLGGNTTVPMFQVDSIQVYGSTS